MKQREKKKIFPNEKKWQFHASGYSDERVERVRKTRKKEKKKTANYENCTRKEIDPDVPDSDRSVSRFPRDEAQTVVSP